MRFKKNYSVVIHTFWLSTVLLGVDLVADVHTITKTGIKKEISLDTRDKYYLQECT